jgi:hypothetical protein
MYLLWAAINGVVLIYFVASCGYAIQTIWQRLGIRPLLVLLLGLYSWGSSAQKKVANAPTSPHEAPMVKHTGSPIRLCIPIENHLLNELTLTSSYWEQPDTTQLLSSHVYLTGLRLGTTWHCQLAKVTAKRKFLTYSIYGTMDWCLLGITLYQEHKHLRGLVPLQ